MSSRRTHTLSLITVLLSAGLADAATINVPADEPTINAAIDAASVGDLIGVSVWRRCAFVFEGQRVAGRAQFGKFGFTTNWRIQL